MFNNMSMISNFDERSRKIVLSGIIDEAMSFMFLDQLLTYESLDARAPIAVYIDSGGGSCYSCMSMYDSLKLCSCPISTIVVGKAMSAATLLAASGDKGARYISPNSTVMVHEISAGTDGTLSQMQNSMNEIRRLQEIYFDLLSKETGVNKSKILSDISRSDLFLTAEQAVKYGICDEIIPTRKNFLKRKDTKRVKGK